MSSPSVVAPQLPGPADDVLVRRLTAEVAELVRRVEEAMAQGG